jgi:hypothetical protein
MPQSSGDSGKNANVPSPIKTDIVRTATELCGQRERKPKSATVLKAEEQDEREGLKHLNERHAEGEVCKV